MAVPVGVTFFSVQQQYYRNFRPLYYCTLTVDAQLQLVLVVQLRPEIESRHHHPGPEPAQLEVDGGQGAATGGGEVAGRRVDAAAPHLNEAKGSVAKKSHLAEASSLKNLRQW